MAATVKIKKKKFETEVRKRLIEALTATAIELHAIARKMASIPNTGVRVKRQRWSEKHHGRGSYTIYPNPSEPDESPRVRTGYGMKNIKFAVRKSQMVARVGYTRNARYMTYHELGIRYRRVGLQQRPTIVPAYELNAARLRALFIRVAKR